MKNFILLSFTALLLQTTYAQDHTYPPVNEVSKDPLMEKFVNHLKQVIDRKDKAAFISLLDLDVEGRVDADYGIKDFSETWRLDDTSTTMWSYVSRVINMGGAFTHDTSDESGKYQFVFPYTYNLNLNIDDDYDNLGVITGNNVNLRKSPDAKSAIVKVLSFDVIWFRSDKSDNFMISGKNDIGDPEWYMIETYDKSHKGWVNWNYVYSLMGPRLFVFKNAKGLWKISAFLSGD